MSELISGKEALIALANGQEVLYIGKTYDDHPDKSWGDAKEVEVGDFLHDSWSFKLKPRTITLNGIEVPAPFKPKEGETYWCFSTQTVLGYGHNVYESEHADRRFMNMGAWRTEDEIKQVVAALRKIFNDS